MAQEDTTLAKTANIATLAKTANIASNIFILAGIQYWDQFLWKECLGGYFHSD